MADAIVATSMQGKKAHILGLARSGMATARALRDGGAHVTLWDDQEARRAHAAQQGYTLAALPTAADWAGYDALILSPGIPLTHPTPHPAVLLARQAGAAVIGDIEILFRSKPNARFCGITGTNGKSTTTALIGYILQQAGLRHAVGGNIGHAALDLADLPDGGIYVLELSSYQLDLIDQARFDPAIILNITPDHLDRHGGMEGYIAAKGRIIAPAGQPQHLIIGADDPGCADLAMIAAARGHQLYRLDHLTAASAAAAPALPGLHNAQNIAAARHACQALGVDAAVIAAAIANFPGLVHRQQQIATMGHLRFINDSKATNPEATRNALVCYPNIYWIAGGRPKEGGFALLDDSLDQVTSALLIGEAAPAIASWLEGINRQRSAQQKTPITITMAENMDRAITLAMDQAQSGTPTIPATILLSPACASFDQYSDFEARGAHFTSLVEQQLAKRTSQMAGG